MLSVSTDITDPFASLGLCLVLVSGGGGLHASDCNGNGLDDLDEIRSRRSADCNGNGLPDECDVTTGYRPESLVVFRCDEKGDSSVRDYSGNGNHGTVRGVTFSQDNPFDADGNFSLSFDHTWDSVDVAAGPGTGLYALDALTLSAHIRPTTFEGLHFILWGDDDVYSLSLRNGIIQFAINNRLAAETGFDFEGVWTHVAATYDGTTAKIYYDGKLRVSRSARYGAVGPLDFRNLVRIGNDETAGFGTFEWDFRGQIDQVRIAGRALLEEEIRQDSTASFTPGTSRDCNRKQTPDECDIRSARSSDSNRNDVPDECEDLPSPIQGGIARLRESARAAPRIRFADGIATFVEGHAPIPASIPDDPVEQALDYLERYSDL